ncbi:MAG TPA: metallophosphoesterase family protein [Ktedonosporobacter sp.]|nr:metallophosphoesterase family protein [Ktedonosporobacter sp.]
MQIAILSDIHGNSLALDAVLADIQSRCTIDAYWVLGDMAALGYDPVGAVERITALPNARFVRGNTDRYVLADELPAILANARPEDPQQLKAMLESARSIAWAKGALTATGKLPWLAELPLEQRMTLPDGTRVLGVHAAPGTDDGPGIHPDLSDDELRALLAGSEADLVFVGHTHVALDRTVDNIRVVNLGSVSNPVTSDLRASYVLLQVDTSGYQLELRRVEYDREAVIAKIQQSAHPASNFLIRFMRGQQLRKPQN